MDINTWVGGFGAGTFKHTEESESGIAPGYVNVRFRIKQTEWETLTPTTIKSPLWKPRAIAT